MDLEQTHSGIDVQLDRCAQFRAAATRAWPLTPIPAHTDERRDPAKSQAQPLGRVMGIIVQRAGTRCVAANQRAKIAARMVFTWRSITFNSGS